MATSDTPPAVTDGYYRQLCEHLGMAVVAADTELTIHAWNAAAARMLGAAADRMIGTSILSTLPEDRRDEARRMLKRAIETGETFQLQFQHRDGHGKQRELSGTIAPVVSQTGSRIGVSVCIRDVTRRTVLQNELNETRKMASLGELAGAIAHHFNNILGGVITSVDYANAVGDPVILARVIRQIGKALHRATALINGLLAFAEGDRRAEDLGDFTEVVNEIADELERVVEARGIEFALNMPQLPVLPIVRDQVRTVLHNIIQNAIEAMPNGGKLSVNTSLEEEWIITRISDTGCGLDAHARSRIFEPFWSTKAKRATESGEGTGLGLAIAHGLMQMIGGSISVSSELNQGSCFTVRFPRPESN